MKPIVQMIAMRGDEEEKKETIFCMRMRDSIDLI